MALPAYLGGANPKPRGLPGPGGGQGTSFQAPEFEAPEWNDSKITQLTQAAAAPGVRQLRRGVGQALPTGYSPQEVQARRATMEGYGAGLSQVMGGARATGRAQYGQQYGRQFQAAQLGFGAQLQKSQADWQASQAAAQRGWQAGESEKGFGRQMLAGYFARRKGGKVIPIKRQGGGSVVPPTSPFGSAVPTTSSSRPRYQMGMDLSMHYAPGSYGSEYQQATGQGTQQRTPQMQWGTQERRESQTWQAEQAGISREWTTIQSKLDRAWQTSERKGSQGWQGQQAELQRLFQENQAKLNRAWQDDNREDMQKFQAEQTLLMQEWEDARTMRPWEMEGYKTRKEAVSGIGAKRKERTEFMQDIMGRLGYGGDANVGKLRPALAPTTMSATSRQRGGPVHSSVQAPVYEVGEEGPELYVPDRGQPQVVGTQGPEARTFPQEGEIIPASETQEIMNPLPPLSEEEQAIFDIAIKDIRRQ